MSDKKCNETADSMRNDGNVNFRCRNFRDSLVSYNRSLCHAEAGSQQLALAYGNRSAVYLELKLFEKCRENIQLARVNGFPADKLGKLNEREKKCGEMMDEIEDDSMSFFKLSYPPNEKIPFIVNCLELRDSEKFGRYIVTKSDLKPGDIIAIEEPFYKFVDKEAFHSRCTNCLKANDLSLIPCIDCTTTMYCSNVCKVEHEKFHRMECCRKSLPAVLSVCTKMFVIAVSVAGSMEKLKGIMNDSLNRTVFDFDLSDPHDPSYRRNLLAVVSSMAMSQHSELVITPKMKAFFNFPPFDSLWETDDDREFLIECFHKLLRIHNTNELEMGEHMLATDPDQTYWFARTIGSGLCPFASLFNHSCDANVKRTCVDNKIAFVVGKPIAPGEQLFISYGFSSHNFPRKIRQERLKIFSFNCDCEACLKDYPEMLKLPRIDDEFVDPIFSRMSVSEAIKEFKKNCDYIEKTISRHPCYETTMTMVHNDHLLHQISRLSLELK